MIFRTVSLAGLKLTIKSRYPPASTFQVLGQVSPPHQVYTVLQWNQGSAHQCPAWAAASPSGPTSMDCPLSNMLLPESQQTLLGKLLLGPTTEQGGSLWEVGHAHMLIKLY